MRRILVLGAVVVTVAGVVAVGVLGPEPRETQSPGPSSPGAQGDQGPESSPSASPATTSRPRNVSAPVSEWTSQEVYRPSLSADGRMMAFLSRANPKRPAVFVRDNQTGAITRVTVGVGGAAANGPSDYPVISANGTVVAFLSDATNLVRGDANGKTDVFVRDLTRKVTLRVAAYGPRGAASYEGSHVALSRDGSRVAFVSWERLASGDRNDHSDVYLADVATGAVDLVSVSLAGRAGGAKSGAPAISAAGDVVAFTSQAPDLVAGDSSESADCFVRDVVARRTAVCSVDQSGVQYSDPDGHGAGAVAISGDGRVVAYGWELHFVHLYDRASERGLGRRDTGRVAVSWLTLDHAAHRLAYVAVDIAASYAETVTLVAGTPPAYVRGMAGPYPQLSMTPDGEAIAFGFVDHSRGRDRPVTGIAICRASRGSCERFPRT